VKCRHTLIFAATFVFVVSGANAHSIKSAYCNAKFANFEPKLNILVQPDGNISGTGGAQPTPFTAKANADGTVDFFRPDGSLWYEGATMTNGHLFATFHQSAANGDAVIQATIPCAMRPPSN
jgi:hypothetical protein